MELIKVKSWSKDQGDFVLIDKDSFDESIHEIYEEKTESKSKKSQSKRV